MGREKNDEKQAKGKKMQKEKTSRKELKYPKCTKLKVML